jgi:undecaprenyl-diphosphatase
MPSIGESDQKISQKLFVIKEQNQNQKTFDIQVLKVLAHLGDTVVILPPFVVLLFFAEPYRNLGLLVLLNSLLAMIMALLVKKIVRRNRPPISASGFNFKVLHNIDKHSFPSGHAARTFSIGTTCCYFMPVLGITILGLAGLISLSRVVLGLHYLGDIIIGGLIGWLLTTAVMVVI